MRPPCQPVMNWQHDPVTAAAARAAANFPLRPGGSVPAPQYSGHNTSPETWSRPVLLRPWPAAQTPFASPNNIINFFQQGDYLEALAMVVSWGNMARTLSRIYDRSLADIERTLRQCAASIQQTCSIRDAWVALTGVSGNQLDWTAVQASKTLHFLCRALGFCQNPPVAIDNGVIRRCVWPAFIHAVSSVPADQRPRLPRNWAGNTFDAYSRYMTAILVWADRWGWATTDVETTLFHDYG
jgi:hypothetical protein